LLQQALSVNLGLLAQVSHAEVELKSKGVNRASSASERKRIKKKARKKLAGNWQAYLPLAFLVGRTSLFQQSA